jgi:predicted secreted acid phosphatase
LPASQSLSASFRLTANARTSGTRFIVVPNPMYGEWENAVYENKSGLTETEKKAHRRMALKGL